MVRSRRWLWLTVLLGVAACRDVAGPLTEQQPSIPELSLLGGVLGQPTLSDEMHLLRQATNAPPLRTHQVSFWASRGRASTISVDYRARKKPFLRLAIPRDGLVAGADGVLLNRGDSVLITVTIDPVNFLVDFQPSGVRFDPESPASLTIWYGYADPDLNGDGVVDIADAAAAQGLAFFWNNTAGTSQRWFKLSSKNDPTQPSVVTALYHFSEYAVSW